MDNYFWRRKLDSSYETVSGAFNSQVESLFKFIEDRTASLSKGFGDDAALLFYDANGGSGITSNDVIASAGEKIKLKNSAFDAPSVSYIFNGWNTEKDGSGKAYKAGEEITPEFLTAARNLQSAGTRLHHSRCAAPAQIAVLQP